MSITHDPYQAFSVQINDNISLGANWQLRIILQLRERLASRRQEKRSIVFPSAAMLNIYAVKTGSEFANVTWFENIQIRPSTRFQILSAFKTFHFEGRIKKAADSPDTCGRKVNPQRKSHGFKNIRISVDWASAIRHQKQVKFQKLL